MPIGEGPESELVILKTHLRGEIINLKKRVENRIRGWLPKEPSMAVAHKTLKSRWRSPYWIALTLVVVVALAAVSFEAVRTYVHYSNPAMDVAPSPYYEKSTNSTTVGIGDIVEVNVWVHWHGYVLPEFKRDIRIVDTFPDNYFTLASGTNILESKGYGGTYRLSYSLRVIGGEDVSAELPKPRLFLDNVEIGLSGESPTVNISSE